MATRRKKVKRKRTTRTMATPRKRRRRRKSTSLSASSLRKRSRKTGRRRRSTRKGFLSAGAKMGLKPAATTAFWGATGGAVYTVPKFFFQIPWWGKLLYGVPLSVGLSMSGRPNMGAGAAGALVGDMAQLAFGLSDGDMQNAQWVDPDTLSDTGLEDEYGNAVSVDDDGVLYALNDEGEYEAIGDAFSLNEGSNLQSVSMLPLSDIYALNDGSNSAYLLN